MDRPIVYDQAQGRDYDVLSGWRENMVGLAQAVMDMLGSSSTILSGFAATPTGPTSLTINLAAGDVYQLANTDTTAYGALASSAAQILQQGIGAAQQVTLSTSGISSGQSRWSLVQAQFSQTDSIPGDDPNGGLLPYLNASNPSGPPWSGPSNSGSSQNTRRLGNVVISVVNGTPATTGSEVPPNPTAGWVPLYLIDLAFGQTTISGGQILTAGPSVGTNVPSNYTQAPFLAGLLNSHHSGAAGQAPQIKLASEVQGVLPYANMSNIGAILTGGVISNDVGTPNTKLDVSATVCTDSTLSAVMVVPAGVINFATNGLNGLDTGSIGAGTGYHIFAISKAGGVAPGFLASTSATAPTLPATYTLFRRLFSWRTDASSHLYAGKMLGDDFVYAVPTGDVSAVSVTTTPSLLGMSVPTGIQVVGKFRHAAQNAGGATDVLITSPDETTGAFNSPVGNQTGNNSATAGFTANEVNERTDTSGRIRAVAGAGGTIALSMVTVGWYDPGRRLI